MSPIKYPQMRAEVVDAMRSLSDPDYQQRVWIQRRYPTPTFYDALDQNVHILFDDTAALMNPERDVGVLLYPDETNVLRELGAVLDPLIDELGDVGDAEYLAHPRWTEVVRRAADAYRVLHANDLRHATGGPASAT